jgi:bacteriocin-like protein
MSDQEKKLQSTSISPKPDAENKKNQSTELSEEELKKVTGGLGPVDGIVVTKVTDTTSPKLS